MIDPLWTRARRLRRLGLVIFFVGALAGPALYLTGNAFGLDRRSTPAGYVAYGPSLDRSICDEGIPNQPPLFGTCLSGSNILDSVETFVPAANEVIGAAGTIHPDGSAGGLIFAVNATTLAPVSHTGGECYPDGIFYPGTGPIVLLACSNATGGGNLTTYNWQTNEVTSRIDLPGAPSSALAFDPSAGVVYLWDEKDGRCLGVNLSSGALVLNISGPSTAGGTAVVLLDAPAHAILFGGWNGTVMALSIGTSTPLKTLQVPDRMSAMATDDAADRVVILSAPAPLPGAPATLSVLNATTLAPVATDSVDTAVVGSNAEVGTVDAIHGMVYFSTGFGVVAWNDRDGAASIVQDRGPIITPVSGPVDLSYLPVPDAFASVGYDSVAITPLERVLPSGPFEAFPVVGSALPWVVLVSGIGLGIAVGVLGVVTTPLEGIDQRRGEIG